MAVEVKGIENVLAELDGLLGAEKMVRNVKKACALVERSAKMRAPKGTGELRRSITSEVVLRDGEITGIVFSPLEYAPYIEYGTGLFAEDGNGRKDVPWHYQDDEGNWHTTSGIHPRPYLRPAVDDNRTRILEILKEGITVD